MAPATVDLRRPTLFMSFLSRDDDGPFCRTDSTVEPPDRISWV
jgi:hypothetical protein